MRIAVLFYGQPRNYLAGYKRIQEFIARIGDVVAFDFFYHSWKIGDGQYYQSSPWRRIRRSELYVPESDKVHKELYELYQPVRFIVERTKTFEDEINGTDNIIGIKATLAYSNTGVNPRMMKNCSNVYSQMYSRYKAIELFRNYLADSRDTYDLVVMSRFDISGEISIDLGEALKYDLCVSDYHKPRSLFPDNLFICRPHILLKWFEP